MRWVPHSVFDETFLVLDILVNSQERQIDEELFRLLVESLCDQYTMQGQFQKKSVQNLVRIVQQSDQVSESTAFAHALRVCVLLNREPPNEEQFNRQQTEQNLNESRPRKTEVFDTKKFQQLSSLFLEKLALMNLCLENLNENHLANILRYLADGSLQESVEAFLLSGNSKIRMKGFNILKRIFETFSKLTEAQIKKIEL